MSKLIDIFDRELECDYKNEHYFVWDNGAVMRHTKLTTFLIKNIISEHSIFLDFIYRSINDDNPNF